MRNAYSQYNLKRVKTQKKKKCRFVMVINYEEKNVFKNVDAILEKRNVLTFKRILLYIILVHWYTRRPHVPGLNESMVQMYIICTSCIIINIVYILYCVHYCSASARKM